MSAIEVHSGETEQLNQLKEEWVSMMEDTSIPWEYEELVGDYDEILQVYGDFLEEEYGVTRKELLEEENRIPVNELLERINKISVNTVVARFKIIPRFQYVVNYLMIHCKYVLDEKSRKEFFEYLAWRKALLDQGIPHEEIVSPEEKRNCEKVWFALLEKVGHSLKANKFSSARCRIPNLEKIILNFDENGLCDLALGLRMDIEDVQGFMRRVLKRSGLNFYNSNEFILYLVLKYAGTNELSKCYNKLKKDYKNTVLPKKRAHTEQEALSWAPGDEISQPGQEWDDEVVSRTRIVAENTDQFLKDADVMRIYLDAKMTELDPAVRQLICWHKNITCRMRTAEEEFHNLYFEAKKLYAKDITRYYSDEEKISARLAGAGTVCICYDPKKRIVLKDRTILYFHTKNDEGRLMKVDFYIQGKTILEAGTYTPVTVPVRSLTQEKSGGSGKRFLTSGLSLHLESGQTAENQIGPDIRTAKGVRRYAEERAETTRMNAGLTSTIQVDCWYGGTIPAGTRFVCEDMGETIVLESCRDVTADPFATKEVTVVCINPRKIGFKRNKDDNYRIVAPTRKICNMENAPEGILKIYNPKPISYQEQEAAETGVMTIQVQGQAERMAGEVPLPAENEKLKLVRVISGVQEVTVARDFARKDRKLEGAIKVKCRIGTIIPKNTEFLYEKNGRKMIFRNGENEININDSLFQRYFYSPENQRNYDNVVNVDLFKGWFEKTRIDNNLLHHFSENGNEKERNCLIALQFLIYEAEKKSYYENALYNQGYIDMEFDPEDYFKDFQEEMDRILLRCGMQTFYMGNPFECLLAFLFLAADSSVNILRTLWSITGGNEG